MIRIDQCTQKGKHTGLFYECSNGKIHIKCRVCGKVWESECMKYAQEIREKYIREEVITDAE